MIICNCKECLFKSLDGDKTCENEIIIKDHIVNCFNDLSEHKVSISHVALAHYDKCPNLIEVKVTKTIQIKLPDRMEGENLEGLRKLFELNNKSNVSTSANREMAIYTNEHSRDIAFWVRYVRYLNKTTPNTWEVSYENDKLGARKIR